MGCEAGPCKSSTPYGIFIVTPSLDRLPSKAKEAPSSHEVSWPCWTQTQYFNVLGKIRGLNAPGEIIT